MKKIYFLAGALLASSLSIGQISQTMMVGKNQSNAVRGVLPFSHDRAPGDVYGSIMDFTEVSDWVIDNSGVDGTGWVIGTDEPSGFYSGGMGPILSTSGGNFALFDADANAGTGYLTMASSIDLSAATNVAFEFESYYRNFTGTASFEISIDGGSTWVPYEVHALLPLNESTANPAFISVNITALAAGESDVKARFKYESTDDYAWMVDDAKFVEGFDDQLILEQSFLSAGLEGLDYYRIPQTQIMDFTFGAYATNNGVNDQTGSVLNVVVNDGASDIYNENSTGMTVDAFSTDSLAITTPVWTPAASDGEYVVTYSLSSDAVDQAPGDNMVTLEPISVGGNVYARDNGISTGSVGYLGDSPVPTLMGNYFEFGGDFDLGLIEVGLSETTLVGEEIYAEVRVWDGADFVGVASSDSYIVGAGEPGTLVRIPLTDVVNCSAGETYMIGVGHYGSGDVRILEGQTAVGAVIYNDGAASQQNSVFIIRAVEVSLGVEEASAFANGVEMYPNPAAENVTLTYNLVNEANVALLITDISGKTVVAENFGLQQEGEYKRMLNTDALSNGVYFYTLNVDGAAAITQRLVIAKN